MPEELRQQDPVIRDLLERMGLRVVECEGFEADDILGTLSRQCEEMGVEACSSPATAILPQLAGTTPLFCTPKRGISGRSVTRVGAETCNVTPRS